MYLKRNDGGGIWWDHRVHDRWDLDQTTNTYTLAGGYYEYEAQQVHMNVGAFAGKNHANVLLRGKALSEITQHITTGGVNVIEAAGDGNWRKSVVAYQWVTLGANIAKFGAIHNVDLQQQTLGGYNQASLGWTLKADVTQIQYLGGYNVITLYGQLTNGQAKINQWASLGSNRILGGSYNLANLYANQEALASFNEISFDKKYAISFSASQKSYIGGYNKISMGGAELITTNQYATGGVNQLIGGSAGNSNEVRSTQKSLAGANIFTFSSEAAYINVSQEMYAAGANLLTTSVGNRLIDGWSGLLTQYSTLGYNSIDIGSAKGKLKISQNALASYSRVKIQNLVDSNALDVYQGAALGYNSTQIVAGKVSQLNIVQLLAAIGYNEVLLNTVNIDTGRIVQSVLFAGGVNRLRIDKIAQSVDLSIVRPSLALTVANVTQINDLQAKGKVLLVDATAALACLNYLEINNKAGNATSDRENFADITAIGVNLALASANIHKISNVKSAVIIQLNAVGGVNYSETNGLRDVVVVAYNSLGANISVVKSNTISSNNLQVGINLLGANVQFADAFDKGQTNVQVTSNLGGGVNFQYGKGYTINVQAAVNFIAGLNVQLLESYASSGTHVQFSANVGVGINVQYSKSSGTVVQAALNLLGVNAQITLDNGLSRVGDGSVTVQVAGNAGGVNVQYAGMGNTVVQFGFNVLGLNAQVINSPSTSTAVQVAVNTNLPPANIPSVNAQIVLASHASVVVQVGANYMGANLQGVATGEIFSLNPSGSTTLVQAAANFQGANIQFGATTTGTTVQFAINQTGANVQAVWSQSTLAVQVAGNVNGVNIQFAKSQGTVIQVAANMKGANIQVALDAGVHVVVAVQAQKGSNIAVHISSDNATTVHIMGAALTEMLSSFKNSFSGVISSISQKQSAINTISNNTDSASFLSNTKNTLKDKFGADDFNTQSKISVANGSTIANAQRNLQGEGALERNNANGIITNINRTNLSVFNDDLLIRNIRKIDSSAIRVSKSNISALSPTLALEQGNSISAKDSASLNQNGSYKDASSYTQTSKQLSSSSVTLPVSQKQADYSKLAANFQESINSNASSKVNSSINSFSISGTDSYNESVLNVILLTFKNVKDAIASMVSVGGGINASVNLHDGLIVQVLAGYLNAGINIRSSNDSSNIAVQVMLANNINAAINIGTSEDYIIASNINWIPVIPERIIDTVKLVLNAVKYFGSYFSNEDNGNLISTDPVFSRMTPKDSKPEDASIAKSFIDLGTYKGTSITETFPAFLANLVNIALVGLDRSNLIWTDYGHDVIVAAAPKNLINAGSTSALSNFDLQAAYELSSSVAMLSTDDLLVTVAKNFNFLNEFFEDITGFADDELSLYFFRMAGDINTYKEMGSNINEWRNWALRCTEFTVYEPGLLTDLIKLHLTDGDIISTYMRVAELKSIFEPFGEVRCSDMDALAKSLLLVPYSPSMPILNTHPNLQSIAGTYKNVFQTSSNFLTEISGNLNVSSDFLTDPSLVMDHLTNIIDLVKNSGHFFGFSSMDFRGDILNALRDDNIIISISDTSAIFSGDGSNVVVSISETTPPGEKPHKIGGALSPTNIFDGAGNSLFLVFGDNLNVFTGGGNDLVIAFGKNVSIDTGAGDDLVIAYAESMLKISTADGNDIIFAMNEGLDYGDKNADNGSLIMDGRGDDFTMSMSSGDHTFYAGSGSNIWVDLVNEATDSDEKASLEFSSQFGRNYLYSESEEIEISEYASLALFVDDNETLEPVDAIETITLAAAPDQIGYFHATDRNDACRFYGDNMNDRFLNMGHNTDMWGGAGVDVFSFSAPDLSADDAKIVTGTVNDFEWGIDQLLFDTNLVVKALALDAYDSMLLMYTDVNHSSEPSPENVSFVVLQNNLQVSRFPTSLSIERSPFNLETDDVLWKYLSVDGQTTSNLMLSHYASLDYHALFERGQLSKNLIDQVFTHSTNQVILV